MLKILWEPRFDTLDPGSDQYRQTRDPLLVGSTQVQAIPRARAYCPPSPALVEAVRSWVLAQGKRHITVMVHGFDYDPGDKNSPDSDPFSLIYGVPWRNGLNPRLTWLPIVSEYDDDGNHLDSGTAIAFAWLSKATIGQFAGAGWNNPYLFSAFDLAPLAAQALAALIAAMMQAGPASFSILAHSLGTRAVSLAIGYLRAGAPSLFPGNLHRLVLLDGAEYIVDANQNLIGGNLGFDVFNIVNTQDRVLTFAAHAGSHPVRQHGSDAGRVIGCEGVMETPDWLDIQVDRSDVRGWFLARQGVEINAIAPDSDAAIHSLASWNHWICYMDGVGAPTGGNREMIRQLLDPARTSVSAFRAANFPVLPGGHYVDKFYYGRFDPAIPPTPMTLAARVALIYDGNQTANVLIGS